MPRILIIVEEWPQRAPGVALLHEELRGAGYETAVVTSQTDRVESVQDSVIRVPFEAPKHSGRLFRMRNALFFDTAANPGNYAMLRDMLHLHLQEVLYDAVVILCPPAIYLKLAYWIDLSFGIPVWVHLSAPFQNTGHGAFHSWNHARLRTKYLSTARLITAEDPEVLKAAPSQEGQLKMLAIRQAEGLALVDPSTGNRHSTIHVLQMLIRRKPQP